MTVRPTDTAAVAEVLRAARRVRIRSGGSRQERRPDPGDATVLDVGGLDTIERLDGPDQTCTVGVGVSRETLDAALAEHDLELGCLGGGTIGGLCASDPLGAAAPTAPSPRSVVLGMDALLADGTAFRSGARVVKNVAGFDLHKLFVGSQGRLFVATRLHLRLRPRPRAAAWFAVDDLDAAAAQQRFSTLRTLATPPAVLRLARASNGSFTLAGKVAGRPGFVRDLLTRHELAEAAAFDALHLPPPAGGEVLGGLLVPSRLPTLLAALPATSQLLLYGGGRFEVTMHAPAASDTLLTALAGLQVHAAILHGAPARRGLATPLDPGQQRLAAGLSRALDPDGKFV